MVRNDLSYDANSVQLILTIFADPLQLFVSAQALLMSRICVGGTAEVPEGNVAENDSGYNNFAFLQHANIADVRVRTICCLAPACRAS